MIWVVELHGRDGELAAIDEVLASAMAGRGRALFVTGEAGIGKSTLLAAARARSNALALAGAAWESPGAPPYWPWIQVLRAAEAQLGTRVHALPGAALIAALVPAWGHVPAEVGGPGDDLVRPDGPRLALAPAAARFALIDAVARALIELARERPLLILLDDLHAADLPSLELLDLLCSELPRAAIAVIAGWRDAELATRHDDAAKRLARASRRASLHPLRRLTSVEVTRWVGAEGAAIHATTEGNPLFVAEMLRARRGGAPPRAIATVLDDHLALVSPTTLEVLAAGSVFGRELEPSLLRGVALRDADAIEAALREAEGAGLGEARGDRWVFRHVLLRDRLYEALPPSRRAALHRAAGLAIERGGRSLTGAAHHLLAGLGEASPDEIARAVRAARDAAARATQVYAFEEAAALLAAAVRALEASAAAGGADIEVVLELSRARQSTGQLDAGQAEALRAAELARQRGDADHLARAALVYATELTSGRRDPMMIKLLEEALDGLPADDGPLRARVMARLGAALVPTNHERDDRPYQLADAALAMASRLGDDEVRLFTLRFGAHAHGFRIGVLEALPAIHEMIALSDRLGRPLETLEQRSWLINAHLVLGDRARADAAEGELAALLARLPQPHYRWRMPIIRATRATMRGDYDEAERLIASARGLARDLELDRARLCCAFASVSVALASRSPARAAASVDEVRAIGPLVGSGMGNAMAASVLAIAGRIDEARAELAQIPFYPPIGLVQLIAEPALVVGDHAAIARAIAALATVCRGAPLAYGPSMSLVLCPIEVVIGEAELLLGRPADAIASIERGLALAQQLAASPYIARANAALAAALAARGEGDDGERLRGLRERLASPEAPAVEVTAIAPTPMAVTPLEVARCDDHVRVRWRARELQLAPAKGLDYLAALVARPDGEIHVSDLVGDEDRGDAGEVIDATARAAYRARAAELGAELDEARARHDLGRIDRLTAELEAVTDQILAGTGLGGRPRRAGSRIERARVNVQRRIRDAIRRLAGEDVTLGRYLEATIRTGTFCSYAPLHDA